ncbi:hypothetical protein OWK27_21070 [Enterobacter cloacae complex sp. 2022EL-00788]|uniref:hypothetical protein n=1 Tax=Enterobacter cloacae complex TaxID=354276 RepID=UPI002271CE5C|nr:MULTISPECIES: hypothetical protein [Enterobacter cloacae complex]MCY0775181.1 hypothetical protein [Enterobacter cloacae complex sp. 2022EL-00788]MDK9957135.1 hypothetical protein [Enterobacter hormaechei]MDL0040986.1 hypothetical protein [Enterobacter hormaechei]
MPKFIFFKSGADIVTAVSQSVYADQLSTSSEYEKIDFETEATDKQAAVLKLKEYLETNTSALKDFSGDITFSSVIESLLR